MLVFDPAHFAHMTGDDVSLQREIVGLFRGQVAAWRGALSPSTPAPGWRDTVHTLKGSARGIGLSALAEACEAAEQSGTPLALVALHAALDDALAALDAAYP